LLQRRPVIEFAQQLAGRMTAEQRHQAANAVIELLRRARSRANGNYARYEPVPVDVVRMVAAYSANLVTLMIVLSGVSVSLQDLVPVNVNALDCWRSLVRLWRSGLAAAPWRSVATGIALADGGVGPPWELQLSRAHSDLADPWAIELVDAQLLAADELMAALRRSPPD
jgi:hypothetical protein